MSRSMPTAKRARRWPLGVRASLGLVLVCVAVGAGAGLASHAITATHARRPSPRPVGGLRGDAVWPAGARLAPGFTLRDQRDRLVSLASQRGHPVVVAFMDSRCKGICPLEGPILSRAFALAGGGGGSTSPALLVVSVNPWEDTAASTRAAGTRWRLWGHWLWLRGSETSLRPLWRAYAITVKRTRGDVSHSTAIYLIDPTGHERAGFNFPFTPKDVAHDLRLLRRARAR